MRKILFYLFILLSTSIFSQEYKFRPVHIGFAYPISTNWLDAENCENLLSVHAFMGISAAEKGLCISGFYNNTLDFANGLQIAGFLNTVKNDFNGMQISGFMGSTGSFNGMQVAGFINMGKDFTGFQLAGFMNNIETLKGAQVAGFMNNQVYDSYGMQLSGFMNTTRDFIGFQTSGFANRCQDFTGMQIGGFFNKTSSTKGVQLAGFMNQSFNMTGLQISGFMNNANDAVGCQIAGFMNKSTDVKGLQIAGFHNSSNNISGHQLSGFMNKARIVKGVQIAGFINTADSSDFPIALINIIKNGERNWSLSGDLQGNTLLSFRSGGRYTYGIIGLGYNIVNSELKYATEAGIGLKTNINKQIKLYNEIASINLQSYKFDSNSNYTTLTWRLLPTFCIGDKFELFAGPSISILWTNNNEGRGMVKNPIKEIKTGDTYRQYYVSGIVGLSYKFK